MSLQADLRGMAVVRALIGGKLSKHAVACLLVLAISVALVAAGSVREAEAKYASIVIDLESGQVLHEKNADTRNYPASLTKMMTLYMVFEALDKGKLSLDTKMKVSRRAAGMAPSKLGLREGETIQVEDAILALVTKSANDVAVVVAEHLGGTEMKFATMMTERAGKLGMTRTTFRNASGLPNKNQLSTARDMARLSVALMRNYPKYYGYFSTTSFAWKGNTYRNHNNLLKRYEGTDGVKTGYTQASGFNLAASVVRNGRRLVAVVFGGKTANSRDTHIMSLLDGGFKQTTRMAKATPPTPEPNPSRTTISVAMAEGKVGTASESGISLVSPARAETVADGGWAVQVGAFRSAQPAEEVALRAVDLLPDILSRSQIAVVKSADSKGTMYRARMVGFTQETEAREACRLLSAKQTPCLVVRRDAG